MTMASDEVIRAAVEAFPDLQLLVRLDSTGWVWLPPATDDEGRPVEVHGVRFWGDLGRDQADGLRIRSETDASAVRADDAGAVLWRRDGGLVDVVQALIELPAPNSPYAPRLVIGIAPRDRWLP